jgi:tRNA modification GTPase
MSNLNRTIVAPATNVATQAIALIRISGDEAVEIINKLVKKAVPLKRGFYFRQFFDQGTLVDEVVITYYEQPNSFTGEEVIEIACHGGILNTNRIINLILQNGAKMALKGEFSQRAFLNGKIDLIQAEGINDLIHATNELALKIGVDNMSGAHNKAILDLKADLLDLISRIQVSIDYPDYDDIDGSSIEDLTKLLLTIKEKVSQIILRSKIAIKNVEGIKTAIIGETNVGKSSLLNALINEDKAIVTEIAGTTRDIVEGQINLGSTTINLIDTAGIRQTTDVVENLGIQKSHDYLQKADLVLYVINANNYQNEENQKMYRLLKEKQHVIVLNKAAQVDQQALQTIQAYFTEPVILTNAIDHDINALIKEIQTRYNNEELLKDDALILININQISLLEQVLNLVSKAYDNILNGFPIDILNVDLYEA